MMLWPKKKKRKPETRWRNTFHIVPKTGKSKIMALADVESAKGCSLLPRWYPLAANSPSERANAVLVARDAGGQKAELLLSFDETGIPLMRLEPFWPNDFLRVPPLNPPTWRIKFQMTFVGDIYIKTHTKNYSLISFVSWANTGKQNQNRTESYLRKSRRDQTAEGFQGPDPVSWTECSFCWFVQWNFLIGSLMFPMLFHIPIVVTISTKPAKFLNINTWLDDCRKTVRIMTKKMTEVITFTRCRSYLAHFTEIVSMLTTIPWGTLYP